MAIYVTKQYYYLWIIISLVGMLELGEVGRRSALGSALVVQAGSVIGDENGEFVFVDNLTTTGMKVFFFCCCEDSQDRDL